MLYIIIIISVVNGAFGYFDDADTKFLMEVMQMGFYDGWAGGYFTRGMMGGQFFLVLFLRLDNFSNYAEELDSSCIDNCKEHLRGLLLYVHN